MSEIREAVGNLKTLLVQFQALQKVTDALETIGNIEKVHADAIVTMNHYKKQEAEAKDGQVSAQSKLEAVVKRLREAEAENKKVLSDLAIQKQEIVNDTVNAKKEVIIEAEKKVEEAEALVKVKKAEAKELDEEISRKHNELEKIRMETTRLKSNLETFIGK